jgi:hypothetical protein
MKRIIILLLIILTAAIAAADDARNRGYGFLMLEEPVNPRNVAMGSVGTALGGAGFRYYNPVLPFFAETPYVTAEFGQIPGGMNWGGFESSLVFPEWFSAVSFHTTSIDFETRDERGYGVGATSATTMGALGVGYIRDNMSAGVSFNMVEDRIWVEAHYAAFALSGGLGYKLFDKKLNLGAAGFYGVGWSRGYGDSASAAVWEKGWKRIPKFARAGAAWLDTLKSFPYTAAVDAVYRDDDGTFTVPVGISVRVLPVLDLRVGKRIGWESEIVSLGIGLNIDKISFDAAFVPSVLVSDYEIKWSMAFTYGLGGSWKKEKKPLVMPPAEVKPTEEDETGAVQGDIIDNEDIINNIDDTGSIDTDEPVDSNNIDTNDVNPDESGSNNDANDVNPDESGSNNDDGSINNKNESNNTDYRREILRYFD